MKIEKPKIVKRPWGVEEWLINQDYCAKRLIIKKGEIIRYHSHKKKKETFFIDKGEVRMKLNSEEKTLKTGDIVQIPPGKRHKVLALKNSVILEASTHHEDSDSYFHSAIFLDRDGVINKDLGAEKFKRKKRFDIDDREIYLKNFNKFEWEDKALEGLKQLSQMDFRLVVVTNQAGIARGFQTEKEVKEIHFKLQEDLKKHGVDIEKIYMCPHDEGRGRGKYKRRCECHKPRPGFLYRAGQELDIELSESFIVGDKIQDIMAGNLAGCKTILVRTGWGGRSLERELLSIDLQPDYEVDNLLDLAKLLKRTF